MTGKQFIKKTLATILSVCFIIQLFCIDFGIKTNALQVNSKFQMDYLSGENWITFNSPFTTDASIDGLRIQSPVGSSYYLEYKTMNAGNTGFYSPVRSDNYADEAYAGSSGKAIRRFGITAYLNDGKKLNNGVIIMYRAYVDGAWLPWVSNASASDMQAVQSKYNLGGSLDASSSDAGYTSKDIHGIDIRIFEENFTATSTDYSGEEGTISMSYMIGDTWTSFNKKTMSQMDGLKLQTSTSKPYRLEYKTWNTGKAGAYPPVSSNDATEYAGMKDLRVEQFGISVYATDYNRKLTSGIVVMYRAYVDNEWLPWVSNATPEQMKSVYIKFNLDGTLDYNSFYAGKAGKPIEGLEIRIFEGNIPVSIVPSLSGKEINASLSYSKDNLSQISFTKDVTTQMDCLWIKTDSNKKYHLEYRVASSAGWYSYVNSKINDYAGVAGKRITKLGIRVCDENGVSINSGVVAMYRTKKSDGEWLPWVSNADPEWMILAQAKYNLPGLLDYSSNYAGLSDGSAIEGVEIRIFEENNLNLDLGKGSKIISTPHIYQMKKYPTGCESVTAVMALNYWGVNVTVDTFIDKYLTKAPKDNFNPNLHFGGNPRGDGMGCYAPVIENAIGKAIAGKKLQVSKLYNKTLQELCSTYIDNNIPVILWATMDMRKAYNGKIINYNGETIQWIAPEHCLLLVGYNDNSYIFRDPMKTQTVTYYSKQSVIAAYLGMGSQAVVIQKSSTATPSTPTVTPSVPTTKPTTSAQQYIKPSDIDKSYQADPIDLYSGSHVIDVSLLSQFAGQNNNITASYRSNGLVEGSMGVGWYHNYEKKLVIIDNNTIHLYDNPSVYSIYTKNMEGIYTCNSSSRQGFTITVTSDGYLLNCNQEHWEKYDLSGRIIEIINHQCFKTEITYSNNITTITDTITNKSLFLQYNSDGLLSRVYDDVGRESIISYDGDFLVSITDAEGNQLSYGYNDNGKIETGIDGAGICYFKNTYDSEGRVIAQEDGNVPPLTTYIAYGENGLRTVTDRTKAVSTHIFDNNGQLISYTDGNGNTTLYEYDNHLNLTKQTDPLGNSVQFTYNSFNKPVSKIDKNGIETFYNYDKNGNLTEVIYPQKGDANIDGYVDILDLVRIKKNIAEISPITNSYNVDLNYDDSYNSLDLAELRKLILSTDEVIRCKETFSYNGYNQLLNYTDLRGNLTVNSYDQNKMLASKAVGEKAVDYTYQNGLLKSEKDYKGNITEYGYNNLDLVEVKKDASENETHYEYDKLGKILKITNANNGVIKYTYDGNGQKRSETDANGNTTWYEYNGNMKVSAVTLPNGGQIVYEYDGEDRLIKTTDQEQNSTIVHYDLVGRKVEEIDSLKNTTSYAYDAVGNQISKIDKNGCTTLNTYDASGNVLTVNDPANNTTSFVYDAFGNVVKSTNSMGGITKYEYTTSGDILSVTDALGNKISYFYDIYGNIIKETNARGNSTNYEYDANNNLIKITNALGEATVNSYDARNLLESTTNPAGKTTTFGYDELGRQTSITDANGHTQRNILDGNGNVLSVIDAKGNIISSATYNEANLTLSESYAAGTTLTNEYSIGGNLLSVTDSQSNCQNYFYDALGRVTEVRDAEGGVSRVSYDTNGNILSLTDAGGATVEYDYDNFGRLSTESTSSNGEIQYTYNALNLKETFTNARSQTRTFSYDLLGRITGYTSPEGNATYTYDENGNVLTATDSNGTVTRVYDKLNRVISYTDTNNKTIKYEYNLLGKISAIIYPDDFRVDYEYDSVGNLTKVTAGELIIPNIPGLILPSIQYVEYFGVISYSYDENNNCIGVTKPDGSITTTVYDDAQRVISTIEKTKDDEVIVGYTYSYDELGRISSETHLADNIKYEYTYDSLSRVLSKTTIDLSTQASTVENYSYDPAGNLLSAGTDVMQYDQNNRLISFNGNAITYDADGNMVTGLNMSLTYDSANRLTSAGSNNYTYDIENIRAKNLCGDNEIEYTYNTNAKLSQLLYTEDENGNVTKYIYGNGLIGELNDNGAKVYHFDYRGSTTAVTDEDGNITDTFKYDTYGKLISRTGTSNVIFLYNGRDGVITDSNGLLYMRARYYNPDLKRFVNADILIGEITTPVTLNRYAYANGNPVSNIDPFGLSAERGQSSSEEYTISPFELVKNFADAADGFELIIGNVKFVKDGKYINIKGDRAVLDKFNINQTRIRADNITNFNGISELVNVNSSVAAALKDKSSWVAAGITIVIEAAYDMNQFDTWGDRLIIGSYDVVSGIVGTGLSLAGGAWAGAKIGSALSPGWGTLGGIVVGGLIGWGYELMIDEPIKDIIVINLVES